jgi:1-deoxy-D-xylulose 5-phosphate reductoisomerase
VEAFLSGRILFTDIPKLARAVLDAQMPVAAGRPFSLAVALEVDAEARQKAAELLGSGKYKKF